MKRKIIYVVLSLTLCITFLMFTACSFDVNLNWSNLANGCSGSSQEKPFEPIPETPPDADVDVYELKMVKKEGFYYPTISGAIFVTKYPHKITLEFNGEERTLTPTRLKNKKNGYIFWFDESVMYNKIKKGSYNYTVKAYYNANVVNSVTVNTVTFDDEYYLCYAVDARTGKRFEAMDCDSNWTPFF